MSREDKDTEESNTEIEILGEETHTEDTETYIEISGKTDIGISGEDTQTGNMSKEDKDTEESKTEIEILGEETHTEDTETYIGISGEDTKNAVVVSQNTKIDSPKTPKSFVTRWIGQPRYKFGCCLSPSTRGDEDGEYPNKNKIQPKSDTVEKDREDKKTEIGILGDTKNVAVVSQNAKTDSPKTPKSFVTRWIGQPLFRLGYSTRYENQRDFEGSEAAKNQIQQKKETLEKDRESELEEEQKKETLEKDRESEIEEEDRERGIKEEDTNTKIEEEDVTGNNTLLSVISQLQGSVDSLTTVISSIFAKDPLEALKKEREELSKFILTIGGLTTVASFSSPPGGLDTTGYIRFRHNKCYWIYLVLSNTGFFLSYSNLTQLHKPLKENEDKAKALRKKINLGWFLLWLAVILFFGSFTTGFWIVYPGEEPPNPITATHYLYWPRWFTLGVSVLKVVCGLGYVFGGRVWARLTQ